MKLVTLDVPLNGEMESPEQNLEAGETITRRVVEVAKLYGVLKGTVPLTHTGALRVADRSHPKSFFPMGGHPRVREERGPEIFLPPPPFPLIVRLLTL